MLDNVERSMIPRKDDIIMIRLMSRDHHGETMSS